MVRANGRIVTVLALGLIGVAVIARTALAAASPQDVADTAISQMMGMYSGLYDRVNATVEEAIGETAGRGSGELTLTQRFKGLATAVAAIEKDCTKTQSQLQKIANKALTQLDRLDADPGLVDEVNSNYGQRVGAINGLKFDASADVFNAVGGYLGFIN